MGASGCAIRRFVTCSERFMGCEKCTREKTAPLSDGRTVCTWCLAYLVECEARYLLSMPLYARRAALAAREKARGSVEELKAAMERLHAQMRSSMPSKTGRR
jgi:hypothetical protein